MLACFGLAGNRPYPATHRDAAPRCLPPVERDVPRALNGFDALGQVRFNLAPAGAMRTFGHERLNNVEAEAISKIGQQLVLVTIGSVTPFNAIKTVQQLLGNNTPRRASTIVVTEVSRAFALASQERLVQAAPQMPGLGKQLRRSGKVRSRWSHNLMYGQVVDADKPFLDPNPGGGIKMQCPHDPKAPVERVVNCVCVALPYLKSWTVATPGAKPFSELELQLDRRKAQLDQDAKRAGRRQG